MVSSTWNDALALLASHEFSVTDDQGELADLQAVMRAVNALPSKQNPGASMRWCVTVSQDNKLELQLQALPSNANNLTGKPLFNRYSADQTNNNNQN